MSHTLLCQYTKLSSSSFTEHIPRLETHESSWTERREERVREVIRLQLMIYHNTVDALTYCL